MTIKVTQTAARRFLVRYQHLSPPRTIRTREQIAAFVKKVGCIQYDPLNRVGRNADLVLQSRCRHYTEKNLDALLYTDRTLMDHWDKNMSILSTADWPFFQRTRRRHQLRYRQRRAEFDGTRDKILRFIKKKGPISTGDLVSSRKVDWRWAPTTVTRAVLESMLFCGELVVHHRKGAIKTYDLAERQIPGPIHRRPDPNPSDIDYDRWVVKRRIGGIGLLWDKAGDAWLGIHGLKAARRRHAMDGLARDGDVTEITIDGFGETFYIPGHSEQLLEMDASSGEAAVIAPLDNLIWDRKLIKALFGFDYKWEVYTPKAKRKYGYYVLPVLFGETFVARFEPVIDRDKNALIILNWWWEDKVAFADDMFTALIRCLTEFTTYCGVEKIVYAPTHHAEKMTWLGAILCPTRKTATISPERPSS